VILRTVLLLLAGSAGVSPRLAAQAGAPTLSLEEVLRDVSARHPVARQARLLVDQADGVVRSALGAMVDPTLSASWERKQFGGSEYYNYAEASLKLPTPLGVDVKLGLERTRGVYIAPDRRTPGEGLLSFGLSMPIGQGIISDRRRAELAAARAKRESADGARASLLNKLLAEASVSWAGWARAERLLAIAREGVRLVGVRADGIRARIAAGDLAPIDSVEMRLEVVRRDATLALAEADAVAAREQLASYLWDDSGAPRALDAAIVPGAAPPGLVPAPAWIEGELVLALDRHPEVRKARGDAESASALSRQAMVEILPDLEGEIARLADREGTRGLGDFPDAAGSYKFGVRGSTGLLLMKERGKAGEAGAKNRIAQLVLQDVRRDVAVSARSAAAAMEGASRAAVLQREAVALAERLLQAEQARFDAGESSLFLVNQRERSLLDEMTKLADADAKRLSAEAKLATALGYPARLPEP
jgi:outer membrane protein TolC